MKAKKVLFYIFMFMPLIVTLIALPFLPAQIPAHYDFSGQVTRWGSKYETLLFPVTTILFGLYMLFMTRLATRQESSGKNNENIVITAGISCLLLFNALTFHALYADFNKVENLSDITFDIYHITAVLLGVILIITGNLMPKARMNSILGLRTIWSMKNEITWKKSQRFTGITAIIAGLLLIAVSLLLKAMAFYICSAVILIAYTIDNIIYSYLAAQKY